MDVTCASVERLLCALRDADHLSDPADVDAWPRTILSIFLVVNDSYISKPSLIDTKVALVPVETKQCRLRVTLSSKET